jgi:hypothetical protein
MNDEGKSSEGPANVEKTEDMGQANDVIVIEEAQLLTPLDEALLDVGKDLIKESVNQSREFHKTMLGLTATFSTLMASFFVILAIGVTNTPLKLDTIQRIFLIVPVFLMLISSLFFALGYYPRSTNIAIEDLTEVAIIVENVLKNRKLFALLGLLSFILAIILLLGGIAFLNLRK